MTSVIEVHGLTKRYRDTLAVDDVSFSIEKNTIYGLLGRNGAGKTTVMSILTAQNFATSGDVRIFGEDPYENAKKTTSAGRTPKAQKPTHHISAIHSQSFIPSSARSGSRPVVPEVRW